MEQFRLGIINTKNSAALYTLFDIMVNNNCPFTMRQSEDSLC